MHAVATTREVIPPTSGSPLSLYELHVASGEHHVDTDGDDVLLYVVEGRGSLTVGGVEGALVPGTAGLVLAGDAALIHDTDELITLPIRVGPDADRHAPLGRWEPVTQLGADGNEAATGARSFQILLGPHNGSTRATLFVGFVPPGKAPWHYHLYDEIVWIPSGPARLHIGTDASDVASGTAFRLRPRQVHIVENPSPSEDLVLVGVFTPAGSPSAAYLSPEIASSYTFSA